MSNANGIITAPVSLHGDVASVLGLGTYDLAALCTSDKINVWAKYKPVRVDCIPELTERQRYEVDYGINVAYAMSLDIASLLLRPRKSQAGGISNPKATIVLQTSKDITITPKSRTGSVFPKSLIPTKTPIRQPSILSLTRIRR